MGIQLNKLKRIIDLSIFCKAGDKLKKQLYKVLDEINNVEIKNIKFHLFLIKFSLFFLNANKIENSKKKPPIGNAEGKKKIPIKKSLSPKYKSLLIIFFKSSLLIIFISLLSQI